MPGKQNTEWAFILLLAGLNVVKKEKAQAMLSGVYPEICLRGRFRMNIDQKHKAGKGEVAQLTTELTQAEIMG